jgi:hypothetical protein
LSRYGDKIACGDHGMISGLLPLLTKISEWPEVTKIVPMKIRGREKAHRAGRSSDLRDMRVVHPLPNGVKIMVMSANSRQQVAVCGPDVSALQTRLERLSYLMKEFPRKAHKVRVVAAPERFTMPVQVAYEIEADNVVELPQSVPQPVPEPVFEPESPFVTFASEIEEDKPRRGRMKKNPDDRKVPVTKMRLLEVAHEIMGPQRTLVTPEVEYLRKRLGKVASHSEMQREVAEMRTLPWTELMNRLES